MVFKTISTYLTPLLRSLHLHHNMTAVVVYTDMASPEHEPRGSHQKNTTVTDRLWTSKILSASLSLRPPVRLAEQTWAAVDAKWHKSNETCVGLQWNQDKRLVEISAKVTAFAMLRMTLPEASGTPDMSHQSFSLTLRRCKYQRPAPCKDDWCSMTDDWNIARALCCTSCLQVLPSARSFCTVCQTASLRGRASCCKELLNLKRLKMAEEAGKHTDLPTIHKRCPNDQTPICIF